MLENFSDYCIRERKKVVVIIALMSVILAYFAANIDVKTVFRDLRPTSHPYVKIHEKFKDTFGGANIVTFMVQSKKGDIFQMPVLEKIQKITQGLLKVDAVNEFQIVSLAGKKLKQVIASTEGIESRPYMWPNLPKNQEEIENLKNAVLVNPLVYGPVVSKDLTATLITVDFYDGLIDYNRALKQIYALADSVRDDTVTIHVVGNPILYGLVNFYLPETIKLIAVATLILIVLLFLINRTWRGTFLPILAGAISAIWALGISDLVGINFDPLVVVIAMLITARAVSHSVQMLTRFHEEVNKIEEHAETSMQAAQKTLSSLLRPGMLGIATDAGCVTVVALSPIPLLQKLVVLAVVWVGTVAVSGVILTPVLLSWVRHPKGYAHSLNLDVLILRPILSFSVMIVESRMRYIIVIISILVFIGSGIEAVNLKVGDANPGSPILWQEDTYNTDSAAINEQFPGADRMFVVFGSENKGEAKNVETLETMERFQRYMEAQPEIGGTLSIADVLPAVSRTLHEDNPRYEELGATSLINGELMYMFEQAAEPGDLDRFVDINRSNASVTLFFGDHKGKTIRTAVSRIKQFARENPMDSGAKIQLAGGVVGVIAAVNEVILSGQIQSIALALLILMVMCIVVYRSSVAGLFFMVPVVISNLVTFAFMAWHNIGMNINTVPVAALGIGLGVDYSLYICDRIKSEFEKGRSSSEAISIALHSAGRGVLVTAVVLIASVGIWLYSSLRFQAEMGLLIGLWLGVSALSALFLMPAMARIFKPEFIFGPEGNKADNSIVSAEDPGIVAT
jgi:predicted RND superfamily exporter protein